LDAPAVHEDVLNFVCALLLPTFENKIKLYSDEFPLFSRTRSKAKSKPPFQREVKTAVLAALS